MMKRLLLSGFILIFTTQSLAQSLACVDVFNQIASVKPVLKEVTNLQPLRLIADPLPTDKKDPMFKRRLLDLLDMYTNSIFQENAKEPFKKRELNFARDLGNGESVEFEYKGDIRSGQVIYRLSDVKLYKQNGQSISLDKSPLSDDGRELKRTTYSLATVKGERQILKTETLIAKAKKEDETLATALEKAKDDDALTALQIASESISAEDVEVLKSLKPLTLNVPLTIDGVMLTSLAEWLKRLPHVKPQEFSTSIASGHMSPLVWKSEVRSNLKFFVKTTKKQFFKFVLLVAVLAGAQQLPGTSGWVEYIPWHSRIEKILHPHVQQAEDQEKLVVANLFKEMNPSKNDEIDNSLATAKTEIKQNGGREDLEQLQTSLATLTSAEKKAGGVPVIYSESLAAKTIPTTSVVTQLKSGYEKGFVVAEFKKQNTILLVPVVQSPRGPTEITVLTYKRESAPATFDALAGLVASRVAAAKPN